MFGFKCFRLINLVILTLLISACGSDGSSSNQAKTPLMTGQFIDSPVENLKYRTVSESGFTNNLGEFNYREGEEITFSIGGIDLPSTIAGPIITPLDLVGTTIVDDLAVVNIARLLQSLDIDGNPNNGIEIASKAHKTAEDMTIDFEHVNFDARITNLVVNSGSLNTTLVSKEIALNHFMTSLGLLSDVDSDGVLDENDNCAENANTKQLDSDNDGQGDVCDITPFGQKPEADSQSLTVLKNQQLNITLTGNDLEGSQLKFIINRLPVSGIIFGTAPNMTYVSKQEACVETDRFTYTVIDDFGNSSLPATVEIAIDCDNSLISYINYSDNPLQACVNSTAESNGWTLISEMSELNCADKGIQNLRGVEFLTGLTKLVLNDNKIVTFDASSNKLLEELWIYNNQLVKIDVSQNTALKKLNLSLNNLRAIDVSLNLLLDELWLNDNKLISVDVSNNTALNTLALSLNRLSTIDVSSNLSLDNLWLYDNLLTSINVSNNIALTKLSLTLNQLTTIDVSSNTSLDELWLYDNLLTSIDVSNNTALTVLDLSFNNLSTIDVNLNSSLVILSLYDNELTNIDISNNTALMQLDLSLNELSNVDVSNSALLEGLWLRNNQLTNIDVSSNPALTTLELGENQLTDINVINNTQLETLWLFSNELAGVDITNNTALTKLNVSFNNLTDIDVSSNLFLDKLWLYDNQLSSIDVTNNGMLTVLSLGLNNLDTVDLSQNTLLETLFLNNNILTTINFDTNLELSSVNLEENSFDEATLDYLSTLEIIDLIY
ncbi:MAG: Leucine-rich repeat (LRR) protein [Oleiphilaceae bacterium]|jgi:Leucine-rich repeat (LRR) protein